MKRRRDIFTGIELGSDKVRAVVASFQEKGQPGSDLVVLGFAESPSLKMLKDEPVTPNIVAEQLARTLQAAWGMASCEGLPGILVLALSGAYIRPQRVSATLEMDEQQALTEDDYEEAMRATYAEVEALQNREDFQDVVSLPLVNSGFRLSNGRTVFNPVGQYSSKLTAESCCFLADALRYDAVETLLRGALGATPLDYTVYAPIAVASAVFPPTISDEPQGLVIDLGAGMTSLVIPTKIGYAFCEQLAIGLDHLANDLSIAFSLGIDTARQIVEQLERLRCTVVATPDGTARRVTISDKDAAMNNCRAIPASGIEAVLEARLRELFQIAKSRLEAAEVYSWVGNEVLLTGPGALLPRVTELAAQVFNRRVRVATPYRIAGRGDFAPGPQHAMVLGLLRCACVEERLHAAREAANGGLMGKLKNILNVTREW